MRAVEGFLRAGEGIEKALILGTSSPHPLINFEIEEYYENEPGFNGIYSRDNLPETIKSEASVINLDEYADVGIHWIALYVKNNKLFTLIVLVLNMFLKKVKDLLDTKSSKQTYLEYKETIQ